ncbi:MULTISPECIES: peptidase domain-containing ABC transporter [Sphingobacterium]|uniref:peptidase domain-containing ABC transporter n=1 Tax=Sphingobacterium TaxID=28453 RepID=UPI00257C74CE|nr:MULTISPECIES: peptidase domain-containing ABC transporter [Sphingobacterium]
MFSFPFYRQLEQMDCGPASLRIIAKYYGRSISLKYLQDICNVTREGVSLSDLARAGERIGFKVLGTELKFEQLTSIPLPCIVHWKNKHFIVVYKVTKKRVLVSDPSIGLISYKHEEFEKYWINSYVSKGVALLFEPTANFEDIDHNTSYWKKDNTIKSIAGYLLPFRRFLYYLLGIMFLIILIQSSLPFITRSIYDVGIQTQDINFIFIVLLAQVVLLLAVSCGNLIRDILIKHISGRIGISLISDYIYKLNKMALSYFEKRSTGDILQRAQDHDRIRTFITHSGINTIFTSVTVLVFSTVLAIYDWKLFLVFFIGNLIYLFWNWIYVKMQNKVDYGLASLDAKNNNYWLETVDAIYDIKINNYEQARRWSWENLQASIFKMNMKMMSMTNQQSFGSQLISNLTNLVLTIMCALSVIEGKMSTGTMIAVQFMVGMMSPQLAQLVTFFRSFEHAKFSFDRLRLLNEHENEGEGKEMTIFNIDTQNFPPILLKNLYFRYPGVEHIALRGINLIIPSKKITAIVGESGSGKSSLLKLLLRLYNPSSGELFLGDINFKGVELTKYRDMTSAVLQESKLFNDTILNNIILGSESIDQSWLSQCMEICCVKDFIQNLELGLQTKVGQAGVKLSGGQSQRILLARALYRNSKLIILDEATNALDARTENRIMNNLFREFQEKTVIISAHRLSTIRKADQIIVISDGTIVEIGTHDQLYLQKGEYFKLIENQLGTEELC